MDQNPYSVAISWRDGTATSFPYDEGAVWSNQSVESAVTSALIYDSRRRTPVSIVISSDWGESEPRIVVGEKLDEIIENITQIRSHLDGSL